MAEADVFTVLADPTRRRIVEVISDRERSVGEIVDAVDHAQPGVSRHLRILHNAGFVSIRADGRRRMYSLRPEPLQVLAQWMHRYAHEEVQRLERLVSFIEGADQEESP